MLNINTGLTETQLQRISLKWQCLNFNLILMGNFGKIAIKLDREMITIILLLV